MRLLNFRDFARCFVGSERAPATAIKKRSAVAPSPSSPSPAPEPPEPPEPVALPDNDDLLREILLRLPPLPSSLPSAALVCRRWRHLVADPVFLHRFRQHHRAPPLLGYFFSNSSGPVFTPALAPPDCIPPARFSLPQQPAAAAAGERLFFLGCRHGLALLINRRRLEAVVWDPVTNRQVTVTYPPEFTTDNGAHCCRGAVLSAAAGADGGDAHSMRPFRVILIRTDIKDEDHITVFMCVYESGTAKWGNAISTIIPSHVSNLPDVLIGDSKLCGFLHWPDGILEFDMDRQSLAVVQTPKILHSIDSSFFRVVRTHDGDLGLAILSKLSIQLWGRRKATLEDDAVAGWVLQKTVELDKLLFSQPCLMDNCSARILGFDEDNNEIHISTCIGAFAIQLESMQFTKFFNAARTTGSYYSGHPYTSFYTEGLNSNVY